MDAVKVPLLGFVGLWRWLRARDREGDGDEKSHHHYS